MKTKLIITSAVIAAFVLLTFAGGSLTPVREAFTPAAYAAEPTPRIGLPSPSPTGAEKSILSDLFETEPPGSGNGTGETWFTATIKIIGRLLLAVVLSAVLAFRPRKNVPLVQRNIYVSQTQILLAVVGAALMMVVGDNAARAFAIFAAVSLVRFRTNIRDPKEITVLLISLALGLAAGVGRWELGVVLCLFSLGLLWILEFNEPEQVYRSMELKIKTRNVDQTQEMLKRLFRKYKLEAEIREIDPPDEKKQVGYIAYYLNLPLTLTTDRLNDKILALEGSDIEGIEWEQKKNGANIYQ